jgi:acyl-CoA synthetase (AMP-forming)/AMP-acid ligase II
MNVIEILREQARLRQSTAALIDPRAGGAISFAALEETSSRAAGLLRRAGLGRGDVVLVLVPMGAELYIALLALLRLGLVAMFPDPSSNSAEIERCIAKRTPRGVIAPSKYQLLRLVIPSLRRIPVKFAIGMPIPGASSCGNWRREEAADVVPCDAETPALITFTSGSTGEPKVLTRTHGFLFEQHRVVQECLRFGPGGVVLAGLPIFVLSHLGCGATSVIPNADLSRPGSIAPEPVIRQIKSHGVNGIVGSPAFLERLAEYCLSGGHMLARVRRIIAGGAPVLPRLLDHLQAMAPGAKVVAVYGSSEAEPIAMVSRDELRAEDRAATCAGHGLLAGAPVPTIRLRILPDRWGDPIGPFTIDSFDAESLAPGEPGEIVVCGNHVLKSYGAGSQDEAANKFLVGDRMWHRTRDAGYLDANGRLWLLGRCAARIVDRHSVTYPFSVEAAVAEDPGVRRAAFFAQSGRRVCTIEPQERQHPDLGRIAERLAWARVDEIRIWKRIPVDRRHNAKVDYLALAKLMGS